MSKIALAIENLAASLTQEQMYVLKESFERINGDIMSISARTNKLLINSDESGKALSSALKQFDNVIAGLESRLGGAVNERIEHKIDVLSSMAVEKSQHDKLVYQVLSYIGEWVDNITAKLEVVNKNTLRAGGNELEELYEAQQNRMDRLEMKLDKIERQLEKLVSYVD